MNTLTAANTVMTDFEIEARVPSIQSAIKAAMSEVGDFVQGESFHQSLREMWQLPEYLRHEFVSLVFLDLVELQRRRIYVPEGMKIQRSEFDDRRPTLFCVSKELPPGHVWKKITITFDNSDHSTFLPVDHNLIEK